MRRPLVWLQILIFFVYTGVELTAGQWCFALLTEGRGMAPAAAGIWAGLFWGSLFAGRVALGFVAEGIGADRLVRLGTTGALLGALLLASAPTKVGLAGLLLLGFSLSWMGFADWGELHRMFTFADWRLFLTFMVGVAGSGVGILLLRRGRLLQPRPIHKGSLIGGLLFGIGWALTGACPGAALVQIGEDVAATERGRRERIGDRCHELVVRSLARPLRRERDAPIRRGLEADLETDRCARPGGTPPGVELQLRRPSLAFIGLEIERRRRACRQPNERAAAR